MWAQESEICGGLGHTHVDEGTGEWVRKHLKEKAEMEGMLRQSQCDVHFTGLKDISGVHE